MAEIVGRFKKGKITVGVVKGKYKDKETTSFTLNKRILKEGGNWQNSDFLTITDLQDIQSLTTRICSDYVKYEKAGQKPNNS